MPFLVLAAASIGGSLIQAGAAGSAANDQKNAANNQLTLEQQIYGNQSTREAPYLNPAYNALNSLSTGLTTGPGGVGTGALNTPFNPQNLDQTPGYQFQMEQGLQALQDAQSATGGATGGPLGAGGGNQLKAITQYGQGLASTTYQQQLQDYMAQQQQQYGQELGVASLGQQAIGALGGVSEQFAQGASNAFAGIGNAQSAGAIGTANAISGGINNLSSDFLLSNLLGGGGGSGSGLTSIFDFLSNPTGAIGGAGNSLFGASGNGSLLGYGPS